MRFWCQLGSILPSVIHQNPSKNPTPRAIKILIDFCFDFFLILAPFWGPSWNYVGHLFRAKTPQDASRTATRRPKTPPRHPKTPQDAPRHPQDAPKAPKTLPRRRFWKDFGDILEDLGRISGGLLGRISCPTCFLKLTFQEPPEVLINWRGGTKAQPSSIVVFIRLYVCWYLCTVFKSMYLEYIYIYVVLFWYKRWIVKVSLFCMFWQVRLRLYGVHVSKFRVLKIAHIVSQTSSTPQRLMPRWIRRARPCACAWRAESLTLTLLPYLFSLIIPWIPEFLRRGRCVSATARASDLMQRLRWIIEPPRRLLIAFFFAPVSQCLLDRF